MRRFFLMAPALLLALTACGDREKQSDAHLKQGRELYRQSKFAEAKAELDQAVADNSRNTEAAYYLGLIAEQAGDLKTAFADYLQAAQPGAHHRDAEIKVVNLLIAAGKLDDAYGRVNAVLGLDAGNFDALALRALIEALTGEVNQAQADSDAVLKHNPNDPNALFALGRTRLIQKDYAGAQSLVDRGLQYLVDVGAPTDFRLLRLQAAVLAAGNRLPAAARALQNLVTLIPQDWQLRVDLADVDDRLAAAAEGEAVLRSALKDLPDSADLKRALVRWMLAHGGRGAAEADLRRQRAATPDDSEYDMLLAGLLSEDGDLAGADKILEEALARRTPESGEVDNLKAALAKLYIRSGNLARATSLLGEVLARSPGNADALVSQALLLQGAGQNQQAVDQLQKLLRDDPANLTALQTLALSYQGLGRGDRAVDAMSRAAELSPGDVQLQLRLLVLLDANGLTAQRDALRAQITGRFPASGDAWQAVGFMALDHGDIDGAKLAHHRVEGLAGAGPNELALRARIALTEQDYSAAATAYGALIGSVPAPDDQTLAGFARASAAAHQGADAIRTLAQVALRPMAPQTCYLLMARLQTLQGDFAEADKAFAQAVAVEPKSPRPYLDYSEVLVGYRQFDRADAVVVQGLSAGAPAEPLQIRQGDIQLAQGHASQAIDLFHSVLTVDPGSLQAANNYGSLIADAAPHDTRHLEEAYGFLKSFEATTNPAILDSIAWLDYRLGHPDSALALLERADAAHQKDPQVRFHLGAVLIALGQTEKGKAILATTEGKAFSGQQEAATLLAAK
jgi:cellulose synthase operon protein C